MYVEHNPWLPRTSETDKTYFSRPSMASSTSFSHNGCCPNRSSMSCTTCSAQYWTGWGATLISFVLTPNMYTYFQIRMRTYTHMHKYVLRPTNRHIASNAHTHIYIHAYAYIIIYIIYVYNKCKVYIYTHRIMCLCICKDTDPIMPNNNSLLGHKSEMRALYCHIYQHAHIL